ncbi:MAG: hypothetical protein IJY44_05105 [Bacteroidaceae bacterium]|nr:hypothetical protein [Bacteroidaceae bacterium]
MRTKTNRLLLLVLTMLFAFNITAQERVYIKEALSVEPGTSKTNIYFTLSLDASEAEERFCAFQLDIVMPEGLEIEYTKAGKPRITMVKPGIYPSYIDYNDEGEEIDVYPHSLNVSEVNGATRVIVYSANPDEELRYFNDKSGDLLKVYIRPSAYLKPGDAEITLRDVSFSKLDATGNTTKEVRLAGITAAANSSVALKVSATNKYSTAIIPFDVETIPAGLEVYSCNSTSGDNLILSRQNAIKAFTPYILYAQNGFEATFSGAVDASKYNEMVTDGCLTGTVVPYEITGNEGHYVMQNKGDGPMFYKVTDAAFSIQPGKCWLTLPAGTQNFSSFRFDRTTDVEEVKAENGKVKAVYDLNGRKVENPVNGIYIINGEKVLVK